MYIKCSDFDSVQDEMIKKNNLSMVLDNIV